MEYARAPYQGKYLKLFPYEEIKKKIIKAVGNDKLSAEKIAAVSASGRICAETVRSGVDLPSQNQSAMDGYAIRASECNSASTSNPVSLTVADVLYPGLSARTLRPGSACYVATGAKVPSGSDAVVRIEETKLKEWRIAIRHPVKMWNNINIRREDVRKGEILFGNGRVLNSSDVALLISVGKQNVKVIKRPRVGILSIGDELTTIERKEKNKIINNYYHLISGYVSQLGATSTSIGVCPDNMDKIAASVNRTIDDFDLILTIGGSSVGAKDITVDAVSSLKGSKKIFHGVRIVPIKPAGLFKVKGKPIVIMPANAISVALTFFLVGRPVLNLISGLSYDDRSLKVKTISADRLDNRRPINGLFLVEINQRDGTFYSKPFNFGSNMIMSLSRANAFVELAPYQRVAQGEEVVATLLGASELTRIK